MQTTTPSDTKLEVYQLANTLQVEAEKLVRQHYTNVVDGWLQPIRLNLLSDKEDCVNGMLCVEITERTSHYVDMEIVLKQLRERLIERMTTAAMPSVVKTLRDELIEKAVSLKLTE